MRIILNSCFWSCISRISILKVSIIGSGIKNFLENFGLYVALTIGCIARYYNPFIAFEIYVKCIESLGHFYSIEIRSLRSFLCFAIVASFGGPPRRSCQVFSSYKGVWHISMSKNGRCYRLIYSREFRDYGHWRSFLLLKLICIVY